MNKRFLLTIACLSISSLFSCGNDYGNFEVTVIFTNDSHGQINKELSFANAGAIKQSLINEGKDVLLFDSGDIISGGLYTNYDKGKSMVTFMEEAGYDAATLGNHEFDYKFDYLDQIVKNSKFPFISTNLYHMKNNIPTTRYTDLGSKVFSLKNNIRVGVIGVSTPESITTSTPKNFQDEQGNYIYTFLDKNNEIYKVVQDEIDVLKNEARCKFVVCLSHLGDENQDTPFTATKLAKNTTGIDAILDGHTHIPDAGHVVKDKNNNDVTIVQAGGKFSNIGKLTLSRFNKPKCELINKTNLVNQTLKNKEKKLIKDFDEKLSTKVATSNIDFDRLYPYEFQENNIGDLITEGTYYYYNCYLKEKEKEDYPCDFTLVNEGGIRSNVAKGDWTKKTCLEAQSFGNGVCQIKVKGLTIINALEFAYFMLGKEEQYFGGFEQLCGAKVTIDTSKPTGVKVDGNNNYISGPSKEERRVDVLIYDKESKDYKPIEEDKDYIIGGSSYILLNGGNGFTMFKGAEKIREEGNLVDNDVLELYVSSFNKGESGLPEISSTNSPLLKDKRFSNLIINYDKKPYGERITIK